MSWMELKVVMKGSGIILTGNEYGNSWGGAAFIWDALCKKYDVKDQYGYSSFEAWKILWNKVRDEEILLTPEEHNVLHFTYDNALVKGEDMQLFADSLRKFSDEHGKEGRVNHCRSMARDIEQHIKEGDVDGLGLYATSVGEDPWDVYDEEEV